MITPFAHWTGHIANGHNPCVICGKAVKHPKHFITVVDGGAHFGRLDSDPNDPGYMGGFAIGPGCWKIHKAYLQPFVTQP